MSIAKLLNHRQTDKFNQATERRLRQRDVEMAARCGEMDLSMEGGEGYERVEGVATFRYLVRPLYQTNDDCPDVRREIMRTR